MGVFYTRKGDKGKSHVGKIKLDKTRLEMEALGQLDELNSAIGVLKSQKISERLRDILHHIQESLFIIQAHVANMMMRSKIKVPDFKASVIKETERVIDDIEKALEPSRKFIISGANPASAWLDLLRAKSRNAERAILRIKNAENLSPEIRAYLNRLSSLFFALARHEARNKKERNPNYK